jgi:beta-lactamase superfamily II metal-dependent hydrolase
MTDTLRVRMFDVLFGDAILVSVPDRRTMRHILIDVGNLPAKKTGDDSKFDVVLDEVSRELGNRPLDLYVMTHEHMDHVQGLKYGFDKLKRKLAVDYAWITASAALDYGKRNPAAKLRKRAFQLAYDHARLALSGTSLSDHERSLLLNNDYRLTDQCVAYLRKLAKKKTTYVYRGKKLGGTHPFKEAKLEILGPEYDTSIYYGRFQPETALSTAAGTGLSEDGPDDEGRQPLPVPPPGVDAGAFYDLIESRRRGLSALFAIDAANNNTSIVFTLEWRGWRLLFTGDAEQRSWKEIDKRVDLQPVHFLKVGHHGSHNGTPPDEILEKLMPLENLDGRRRSAGVSTCKGAYHGIPHPATFTRIRKRCDDLRSTLTDVKPGKPYIDFHFSG